MNQVSPIASPSGWYLIVAVGRSEEVLCTGAREELESLAKKFREEALFRWVRVDSRHPREAIPTSRIQARETGLADISLITPGST
jgi:hypothetical protein